MDQSPLTRNATSPIKLSYVRNFEIGTAELYQTDFGISFSDGCQDYKVGVYTATVTEQQEADHDPRELLDLSTCRSGRFEIMRLILQNAQPSVAPIHLESAAQDISIGELYIDAEFATEPSYTFSMALISGNSQLNIDRLHLNTNKRIALLSVTNPAGNEHFNVKDIYIKNKLFNSNPESVTGMIKDLGSNGNSEGFRFGMPTEYDIKIDHSGNGVVYHDLGNVILDRVWLKSSVLTSASVCGIECVDDTSRAVSIPRTSNDEWHTWSGITSPIRLDTGGGGSSYNRMDLTHKRIKINTTTAGIFYVRVKCRRVDYDLF